MGEIINTKNISEKYIINKILLDSKEALYLKNAMRNINLFSGELCKYDANIIKRGKNGVTNFFEIPLNIRTKKIKLYNQFYNQKIETKTKIFYIYVIKKNLF